VEPRTALSLLLVLVGCATWTGVSAQDSTSDEKTIRSLDDQERTAVLNQDIPALERLWSDRFVVNAPNTNRVGIGRQAALDLVRRGLIHYSSFERRVEFIRVDGDVAIIMGGETVRPIGDAPSAGLTVQRRFTNIWKKDAGTWHLIARHANVIPPH
jgi:ketosteroid isomerase-like protein